MQHCIIGAGGFAREVKAHFKQLSKSEFYVDPEFLTQEGTLPISDLPTDANFVLAIGDGQVREKILKYLEDSGKLKSHKQLPRLVPDIGMFWGDKRIKLGVGSIICPGTQLTCDIEIGIASIINIGCMIGHDVCIGDLVTLSPSVNLMGNVTVQDGATIHTGAIIVPGVTVGKKAIIGAGAVVLKDVPDYATVVGNPGKVIKIDGKPNCNGPCSSLP